MHKNVQTNTKISQKFTQHSCCSLLTRGKKLKSRRGNRYRFVRKCETFPTETITLVVRSSGLWEVYTQTCPKCDKICTMTCWCRYMIPCQVSWISDEFWIYWNLKTRYLNVCRQSIVPWCLKFIPISYMGPKDAPKDTDLILQQIYMHWSMCM